MGALLEADDMNTRISPRPGLWRRTGVLSGLGLCGVLSLLLQPVPEQRLLRHPELAEMPVWLVKLVGLLNPALLLVVAALLGALLAHRVGLCSVLAGTAGRGTPRAWALAAGIGLITGVAVAGLDRAAAPLLGDDWIRFLHEAAGADVPAVFIGILYGGITEEILMRWGLMSSLAWVLWTVTGKRRTGPAIAAAILVSALAFGAAHLPVLAAQIELTTGIVLRTLLLNALAGAVYGWIYWRHHLEAAMLCHACSHLALAAIRAVT